MRKKTKSLKRIIKPDTNYNSVLIAKFINYTMKNGKKTVAKRIVYNALGEAQDKLKKPALEIFESVINNVSPLLEVRSRRIGGATYQVPMEVRTDRKVSLAMRWILESAKDRHGKNLDIFLAEEIINAFNRTGYAMKRREDMHKSAEANKAFAHFARF